MTGETGGSTQHSDDAHNKSSSIDGLTVTRNLSNNDAEVSNEDNLSPIDSRSALKLSKAQQITLSTEQLPSVPLDGFADKVRKVAFKERAHPPGKERAISGDELQN